MKIHVSSVVVVVVVAEVPVLSSIWHANLRAQGKIGSYTTMEQIKTIIVLNLVLRQVAKFVFLSICRKNRIFADYFSGKTFASPLEDYISAVSQSILNFQKKPERSLHFLEDDANHDLLSLFV